MADDKNLEQANVVIGAIQEMTRALNNLKVKSKEVTEPSGGFAKINEMFTNLAKGLSGPVGVAAGFYAVAKSIESVAQSSVQLSSLARNTNLTADNVRNMQTQFRMAGLSAQEANSSISTLGGHLNNILAFQAGSAEFQKMSESRGGAVFGLKLIELEKAGNRLGTITEIIKTFRIQDERGKIAMAQWFGMTVDQMERLNVATLEHARAVHVDEEELRLYHERWVKIERTIEDIAEGAGAHAAGELNKMFERVGQQGYTAQGVLDFINRDIDKEVQYIEKLIRTYENFKKMFGGGDEAIDAANKEFGINLDKTPMSIKRIPSKAEYDQLGVGLSGDFARYRPEMDPMGVDYTRPESLVGKVNRMIGNITHPQGTQGTHPDITDFGGMRRTDELINIERGSSKTLQDIRDMMMGDGGAGGTGGTSGAAAGSAGGRRSLGRAIGIDRGGTGGGGGSGGGFKDPGDANVGTAAPNEYLAAQRAEIFQQIDADPDLKDQLAKTLATEGNTKQGRGTLEALVNRMLFFRSKNPNDPRGKSVWAELNSGFYGPRNVAATGRLTGKPPLSFHLPHASSDQMRSYDWAAAQVRAGSNVIDLRTDQGTWGSEVQQGVAGGTNVAGEGYAHWPAHGNYGPAQAWTMRERERLRDNAARGRIDKSQSMNTGVWGGINAYVEFKNVPPGVATHAETSGDVFHDLQINKTKQAGVYRESGAAYE